MAFWNRKPAAQAGSTTGETPLACSFCGKTQQQVKQLIAGPSVYICDECVGLCVDIVATEAGKFAAEAPPPPPDAATIQAAMQAHVAGHASLVALLSQLTARNAHASGTPPTILLVGAAGVGKTQLCKALVAACGVPAAHAHAHRMTATGYIGADLENVVQQVVLDADGQPERAARGLLVFEDLHHLALLAPVDTLNRDVGGRDVQPHLVRLLDRRALFLPDEPTRRLHPQAPMQRYDPTGLLVLLTCRMEAPPATEAETRDALRELGLMQELLDRVDLVLPVRLPDATVLEAVVRHHMMPALGGSLGPQPAVDAQTLQALLPRALAPGGTWNLRQALVRRALVSAPDLGGQ